MLKACVFYCCYKSVYRQFWVFTQHHLSHLAMQVHNLPSRWNVLSAYVCVGVCGGGGDNNLWPFSNSGCFYCTWLWSCPVEGWPPPPPRHSTTPSVLLSRCVYCVFSLVSPSVAVSFAERRLNDVITTNWLPSIVCCEQKRKMLMD